MSDPRYTIHVNLDAKCVHCGRGGATPSGRCMGCVARLIKKYGLERAKWPTSGKIRA